IVRAAAMAAFSVTRRNPISRLDSMTLRSSARFFGATVAELSRLRRDMQRLDRLPRQKLESQQQSSRHDRQSREEPPPQTDDAPAEMKPQKERDGKPDEPVPGQVRVERVTGVARAAKHAGADRLNAVR